MANSRIGVVGGSGLYAMDGLEILDEVVVETPFGEPSDAFLLGTLEDKPVVFLARHGRGHRYNPSEVPYRANIYGFKVLGVSHLFSVSAVGSLKHEIEPLHLVVPHQFIDRTHARPRTFFENGLVGHVSLADPVCADLSGRLVAAGRETGATVHEGGTYLCIEGPQFSTRAESHLYRSWGVDVIGMTNATEARLAREAGIAYATLAMACDYDCWHEDHDDVTAEMAVANLTRSVESAQRALRVAVAGIDPAMPSSCAGTVRSAIFTHPDKIPADVRRRLALLLDEA